MRRDVLTVAEFRTSYPELVTSTFRRRKRRPIIGPRTTPGRRLGRWAHRRRSLLELAVLIVREPGVVIGQLLLRRRGLEGGSYQWRRLHELRRLLRTLRPRTAIELGSGASTLLLNKYVTGDLVVLEEDERWRDEVLRVASRVFPRHGVRLVKSIRYARRRESEQDGVLGCHYELPVDLAEKRFFFAYVDGPTAWLQEHEPEVTATLDPRGLLPNIDVTLILRPSVIAIDTRRATVRFLIEGGRFDDYLILLRSTLAGVSPGDEPSLTFGDHYHTIMWDPQVVEQAGASVGTT